jgi:hypothetical protein
MSKSAEAVPWPFVGMSTEGLMIDRKQELESIDYHDK